VPEQCCLALGVVRSLILFTVISLSGITLVPARLSMQQGLGGGQYTIAVDVDLVVFNMTVTDGKGRHVSGLRRGDFHIYEENRLQDITLFYPEDVPASVGLIIDNSSSMRNKRADVAKAALAFAGASNSEDEMFVVNFNENVYLSLPPAIRFTNDLDLMRLALLRTAPAGLTALYDALALGIEHLKTGTRGRKALIVLSDGGDNASSRGLDDVLQMAQRSSATIYTIGIYDETDRDRNPRVLRKIAGSSGGRAYFPDSLNDLEHVWREIAGAIRSQYTIGYHSSNTNRDGMFRKVRITASRNGGRGLGVTTRDGYIAPADKSIP
jgi:Ca-activated chloride channel family protein